MKFTVYRSSAGSGKTFTLVKEYLKIALSGNQDTPQKYRHILAITFTNKAAAEMKERVISALTALSSDKTENSKTNSLLEKLIEETSMNQQKIKQRAKKVLQSILHNYSEFAVCTIDSFTHRIIRAFAHDLNIPLNFDVELDADKLLTKAINLIIDKTGTDKNLTKALVEFTLRKTDEEKNWHIENDLHQFAKNLLKETGQSHISKLQRLSISDFFEIMRHLNKLISEFESTARSFAEEAWKLIRSKDIGHQAFYRGQSGIGKYFEKLASGDFAYKPNSYLYDTIENNKWHGGKTTGKDKSAIDEIKTHLTAIFRDIQELYKNKYSLYSLFVLIRKNIYSLALLNEIEKTIENIKHENNVVHISEFNKQIAGIVMSEPAPFIYERIGEWYNNYLIDEFQDTSLLQWQNLLPLIENSLASGNFNMVVGDAKQAIYRWRNGEVEQLVKLPEIYGHNNNPVILEKEAALIRNYKEEQLIFNFRSKAVIIEFNNWFFNQLFPKLEEKYHAIYGGLSQKYGKDRDGGYVRIEKTDKDDNEHELHPERTLAIINESLKDGYSMKDIAILCRRKKDAGTITEYLLKHNIRVISSESLLLINSPEINFIINFLRFLNKPKDKYALIFIIQYLIHQKLITDDIHEALKKLACSDYFSLENYLGQHGFNFNEQRIIRMPVYEMAEELMRIFRLNKKVNPYLPAFLDVLLNYTSSQSAHIMNFIEWWDENAEKYSVASPEETDAVQVMTVHKSKGLEFPVVIFPFAGWRIKNSEDNIWVDLKDEVTGLSAALVPSVKLLEETNYSNLFTDERAKSKLDSFNILYVAFTRASERLYVIVSDRKGENELAKNFLDFITGSKDWNAAKNIYESGSAQPKHIENNNNKEEKKQLTELHTLVSTPWQNRLRIRKLSPEMWDTENQGSRLAYGNLVHTALSRIRTAEDITLELEKMKNEGYCYEDEKIQLQKKLSSLLANPEIKKFFDKEYEAKMEADILLASGETIRPDRVIIKESQAIIIDYKTGKEDEKHKKQLNRYEKAMMQMGYNNIEKYLVYTEEEKVITV